MYDEPEEAKDTRIDTENKRTGEHPKSQKLEKLVDNLKKKEPEENHIVSDMSKEGEDLMVKEIHELICTI